MTIMEFIFTKHIKDRLKQRGLSEKEVKSCISNPDRILDGKLGKKIAIKKNFKVIYTEEDNKIILITAYKLGE